jgi:hypothetical protein
LAYTQTGLKLKNTLAAVLKSHFRGGIPAPGGNGSRGTFASFSFL